MDVKLMMMMMMMTKIVLKKSFYSFYILDVSIYW